MLLSKRFNDVKMLLNLKNDYDHCSYRYKR
jgi:hypothetical protein